MTRDFDRMFLNLDDSGNVPQYPGYPGYQLFATLIPSYAKILGETKCQLREFPRSGLKAMTIEIKSKSE